MRSKRSVFASQQACASCAAVAAASAVLIARSAVRWEEVARLRAWSADSIANSAAVRASSAAARTSSKLPLVAQPAPTATLAANTLTLIARVRFHFIRFPLLKRYLG